MCDIQKRQNMNGPKMTVYPAGSKVPPIIISIPSGASSVQESTDNDNKIHYGSSSEEESGGETINDNEADYDKPEVLLKRTRKQARRSTGDDAMRERVRCVALTRIVYGDCHWQLAKAYSKLAQAYHAAGDFYFFNKHFPVTIYV